MVIVVLPSSCRAGMHGQSIGRREQESQAEQERAIHPTINPFQGDTGTDCVCVEWNGVGLRCTSSKKPGTRFGRWMDRRTTEDEIRSAAADPVWMDGVE